MLAALLIRDQGEWAVLAPPLAGAAIGAINGVLAAYARLPSFLITLGMLFAVNGMTLYLKQGAAIGVEPDLQIQSVFNGFLFGSRPFISAPSSDSNASISSSTRRASQARLLLFRD